MTNRTAPWRAALATFTSQIKLQYDEIEASSFRLFHPREDRWEEHFRADEATGSVIGLTSVARATLSALQMNRTNQLTARLQWIRIGLYP
jgi:hypothetical protein